ncbi:MAG: AbfB domain-containing protein [Methanosarcinaceae archaeon]|nr:AbfB domain-containing protein [Methanosarcinaceae archaeon]
MKWYCNKLFSIVVIGLLFISMSAMTAAAGVSAVLNDGDARSFTDAPDIIAYANTEHTTPPSEFQITTSGATWPSGPIWRYNQVIALMNSGSWVEAKTTVATNTVGIQFWGDTNDGWARVLVDGSEVWTGNIYGFDVNYPGGAFVKYLEISGLASSTHTIRVENMGVNGAGGGDDVTIVFFGLEEASSTTTPAPSLEGEIYSIQSYNYPDYFIRHRNFLGEISKIVSASDEKDASFRVVPGLADSSYVSFESVNYPGYYLRHQYSQIKLHKMTDDELFKKDSTFKTVTGLADSNWISFESYNYPDYFIRHKNGYLYIEKGDSDLFRKDATFKFATPNYQPAEETTPTSTPTSEAGLVAHYPFDGNYDDSSKYQNDGTPKGNMDFTAGVVGNAAANFDGKSYIEVEDSDSLDLTGDLTFSVWLNKKDSGVGGWAVVLSKGDTSSTSASNSPYALVHASGKYPGVRFAGQIISSNAETNYNEWYLLTVTREGSDLKFYINGEFKDTKRSTASTPKSVSKLLIGIDPPGATEYFKGAMDDLRIYNYALSQSEIRTLYEGETAPPAGDITPPSTVGFSGLIFESRGKSSGSSVQIPLTLNGIKENIGNMDITLGYDSSVLEATEVIKGGLTTNSLFDYNIVDGTIKISLADKAGFSGDGSIAYVRFDVIGAEGSSSPLEITKLSANKAEDLSVINIPAQDGVFKVVSLEESLGDVDGDGMYTAVDALYALQMAVGKIPEDLIMDMNGDGQVSSIDARKILRIAAELE